MSIQTVTRACKQQEIAQKPPFLQKKHIYALQASINPTLTRQSRHMDVYT